MSVPNNLDATDRAILRLLQEDAKETTKEIAAKLGLTPSPIYERVKRLEREGYIKRYVAILDKTRFNLPVTAFCQVAMRYHDKNYIEQFEAQIGELKEVRECYHLAGKVDFMLKIFCRDLEEYHQFVRNKLSKVENIGELNTSFVLKEVLWTSSLPL